jgi:hypothetical protein
VDRLTLLCFTASGVVHAWEFVYDLSAVGAVISSISRLFSLTISEQCVPSWWDIIYSDIYS